MNSERAQSARGVLGALLLVLAASLALLPLVHLVDLAPSAELLRALAGIGALLLVAYAVEVTWLPKTSGERGRDRASWVGYVSGIGLSALLGVFLALIYSEGDTADLAVVPEFGLAWVFTSLALLGLLVALLPLLVFERSRSDLAEDDATEDPEASVEAEDAPFDGIEERDRDDDDLAETRELDE